MVSVEEKHHKTPSLEETSAKYLRWTKLYQHVSFLTGNRKVSKKELENFILQGMSETLWWDCLSLGVFSQCFAWTSLQSLLHHDQVVYSMTTSSALCFASLQNIIHISANIRYPQNSFNTTTWRVVVNLTEPFLEEIMFVRISPKCMASLESVIKQKDFIFSLKLF